MNDEELKDCPFCGRKPEIIQTGKKEIWIRCTSCLFGAKQKVFRFGLDWLRDTLIKQWNKRV